MRIAVFGGSFNPPHKGHVGAALEAKKQLRADRMLVVPTAVAPHKSELHNSPSPEERLELTRLAFKDHEAVFVSDIETSRGGRSYTVDTLEILQREYPGDELILLMGTDMLMCFDNKWASFERILELAEIGVFARASGQDKVLEEKCIELKSRYGARIEIIEFSPLEISSTELRGLLRERKGLEYIPESVYAEIIKRRYYDAKPELPWLREQVRPFIDEKRMRHTLGVEQEAKSLAQRWGADPILASEAGILHDITKKQKAEGQLKLCEKYGIITDGDEKASYKLLHSKTGAAMSRDLFGICDEVYSAIFWHTTGRAGMTLLDKIIYIADYIEPNRDFEGLDRLRRLAYENLDRAVELGLEMSLEDLSRHGKSPHANSLGALASIKEKLG